MWTDVGLRLALRVILIQMEPGDSFEIRAMGVTHKLHSSFTVFLPPFEALEISLTADEEGQLAGVSFIINILCVTSAIM